MEWRSQDKIEKRKAPRVPLTKRQALQNAQQGGQPGLAAASGNQEIPADFLPPNKILFIQNLPAEATDRMLEALFSQYQGYREVRMVPAKKDIAFVEFETETEATAAKQGLSNFKLTPDHEGGMKITFAKR